MHAKNTTRELRTSMMNKGATIVAAANIPPAELTPAPPPQFVKVDFTSSLNKLYVQRPPMPSEEDPHLLWKIVRDATLAHHPDLKVCFNSIARMEGSQNPPVMADGPARVFIRQYAARLRMWGVELSDGALLNLLEPYEFDGRGVGFDYCVFMDILNEVPSTEAKARHEQRAKERLALGTRKLFLPSQVFTPTTSSVPQGKYGGEPQCRTLHGSAGGLNINDDGTNNGFYFDPS